MEQNMNKIEGFTDDEDDIHICGLCRAQFSDVELFIQHRKNKCPVRLSRQKEKQAEMTSGKVTLTAQPTVVSTTIDSDQFTSMIQHDQCSGNDEVVVQLEQDGENIGYYSVSHQGDPETSRLSQHQYVILPCSEDEDQVSGTQTIQTDSQAYSTLDTVYTLNSHPLQSSTSQITNSIPYPVSLKCSLQADENTSFRESDCEQDPVAFSAADEMQEPVNTRIPGQSDCVIVNDLQEPVCYSSVEENFQPVNYSKNSMLSGEDSGIMTLLKNDQSVVVQNLDHLNIQQTGTQIQSIVQSQETISNSSDNQSVLRAHLIGQPDSEVDRTDRNNLQLENFHRKLTPDVKTKARGGGKRNDKKQQVPVVFQYKVSEPVETPKKFSAPLKKEKKVLPEKKFACKHENCSYKTAYLKDLERHNRVHTGDKPYKCQKCPKTFARTDKLTLHLRYHMDDRAFKCNLCNYSAVENGSLKKHMKTHFDERPFSCQVCPYKSRSSSQLQIHLRVHTGDKPYSCKYCEAVFKVSSDLHRHVRIHTGEKPFKCRFNDCSYRCAVKSNLRSHYQTHHSQNVEYKCPTCDFSSSSRKALFEHKKEHNSDPELTCKICQYQCSNKSALRHHSRLHGSAEPFTCNYCEYKSVQRGNVEAHMIRKHPNKVIRQSSWRKRRKGAAGSEVPIRPASQKAEDIKSENVSSRGKLQPKCVQNFKCNRCPSAFVREDSLRCHIKQHDDSSLSTAYAVLKLQQPVINTSNTQTSADSVSVTSSSEPVPEEATLESNLNTESKIDEEQALQGLRNRGSLLQTANQVAVNQSQTIPNQSVTLGINDILMAAGISGINSNGNSPTSKLPMNGDTPVQDLSLNSISQVSTSPNLQNPADLGIQNAVVGSSPQDVPSVQVMQNISLPYIKLPNGQVLILTGQTSMNQIITQPDGMIQSDSSMISNAVELQSQLLSQPACTQQQIVQCAADSTVDTPQTPISGQQPQGTILPQSSTLTTQDSALTQQQGAIPIQLILPSDSQQSVPIVTQLLNSVINRNSNDIGQNQGSVILQSVNQSSGTDSVQNFVLQIPPQSGISRDPSGNLGESQSFVLQIPGTSNFN